MEDQYLNIRLGDPFFEELLGQKLAGFRISVVDKEGFSHCYTLSVRDFLKTLKEKRDAAWNEFMEKEDK